jgi:hypothetical protein
MSRTRRDRYILVFARHCPRKTRGTLSFWYTRACNRDSKVWPCWYMSRCTANSIDWRILSCSTWLQNPAMSVCNNTSRSYWQIEKHKQFLSLLSKCRDDSVQKYKRLWDCLEDNRQNESHLFRPRTNIIDNGSGICKIPGGLRQNARFAQRFVEIQSPRVSFCNPGR